MDLSMPFPSNNNVYIHKNFGQVMGTREVDVVPHWQQENFVPKLLVSPAHYLPYNFMGCTQRPVTPLSADYATFATNYNASSTPGKRRQCQCSDCPFARTNTSVDSDFAMPLNSSPTAIAATAATANATAIGEPSHYQLKRQLRPALQLTHAPLKQSYLTDGGGLSAEKIFPTPVKRKHSYKNHKAIRSPTTTSHLRAITHENSTAKNINAVMTSGGILEINTSVIKSVLKQTPVDTLELAAATTSNAASSANPTATAAVLSEDKLRSICTYHTNMVRKFPQKERTPKHQERRNKNTIACRMSRRVKKLQQIAVEQQCKEILRTICLLELLEGPNLQGEDDEIEAGVCKILNSILADLFINMY